MARRPASASNRSIISSPAWRSFDIIICLSGVVHGVVFAHRTLCHDAMADSDLHAASALACSEAPAARVAFLLRNWPRLTYQLMHFRGDHAWSAASMALWFLRLALALTLPSRMYSRVAAPVLTYATRASPLLQLLLSGPTRRPADSFLNFFYKVHPFGDAFLAVTVPTTYSWAEFAFNLMSLAVIGLAASWHQSVPGGSFESSFGYQMGLRVSIVLLIHNAFLRRKAWEIFSPSKRTAAATAAGASCPSTPGGNGSSCSGDASTEDAAGAFVAPCLRPAPPLEQKQQQQQQQLLRLKADAHAPCCCQSGEEDGRGEASEGHSGMDYQQQQHRMPRNHYACPGADFPAAAAQRSAKDANDCNAASAAAAPDGSHGGSGAAAAGCDAARPCPPLTALQVGRGAALPEAAAAVAAGLSPAAAASLSAVLAAAPSAGLLPYKSPIRRRTTRVKIPWAEPEQLTPGYVERLQELAAERGVHLAGVYVRAGCIELLLDEEMWGSSSEEGSGGLLRLPEVAAAVRTAALEAPGGSSSTGGSGGDGDGGGGGAFGLPPGIILETVELEEEGGQEGEEEGDVEEGPGRGDTGREQGEMRGERVGGVDGVSVGGDEEGEQQREREREQEEEEAKHELLALAMHEERAIPRLDWERMVRALQLQGDEAQPSEEGEEPEQGEGEQEGSQRQDEQDQEPEQHDVDGTCCRDVATAGSVGRGLPAPAAPLRGALPPHNPCMLLMQPRVLLLPPLPIPNPTAAFAAADGIAETEHSLTHIRAPAPTAAPTAVASPDVSPAGPDSTYIPAIPIRRLRPPSFLPTPAPAPTPDPTSALTASPTASPTAAHEAPAPTALPAHVANASGEPCLPARVPLSVLVSCPASDCLVEPEVLVRGQGMYLPATARLLCAPAGMDHAADSAAGPDVNGTACHEVVLWGLPPRPGVVLIEFRWANQLARAVPLLLTDDPAMAAEMQTVSASWCGAPEELDALLLDLGTWGYHVAVALHAREAHARNAPATAPGTQAQQQQAQVNVGAASAPQQEQEEQEDVVGGSSLQAGEEQQEQGVTHGSVRGPAGAGPMVIPGRLARLGVHLLRHAAACGWPATTNHLAVDLARTVYSVALAGAAAPAPAVASGEQSESGEAEVVQGSSGAAGREVRTAGSEAERGRGEERGERGRTGAEGKAEGVAVVSTKAVDGSGGSSAAAVRCTASRRRTSVRRALWQVVGLGRADAAEEEAYQAYAAPLIFAQGMVIQLVELASLLALLFRARHELLSRGNLTTLSGCAVGTFNSLTWLLLPYGIWVKLVNASKVPRYAFYMLAKAMIALFGFPAPPGIVPYQLGPGMLVMEGLLLPGSCLLDVRTAAVITLLKWPLAVGMMLASGATADPWVALTTTGWVVPTAMATTVACHVYLRVCYQYHARRAAAAAAAGGRPAAGMVVKGGKAE